ncbi:ATP-binding protein [Selenomonas noxia]|jgi:hypothetical protein|uniref:ATP-binding protein n=1 Tax=Selenomonas noxia TaxID=135083 RepID=UPI0023F3E1D1|nr:DUF87 domain-containing protein [Selenomonas noxia]
MNTLMENAESMKIGSVDFVSPSEIRVLLDLDAPSDVALNGGTPRPFPRVNSYVLVPAEGGFLVAQVEWITIERAQFPKRRGMQDFGVLDLPYPLRKMSIIPLGVLREKWYEFIPCATYEFSRGIEVFPTVGDPVLIPTQNQLHCIIESGSNRRVHIGVSPLAGNANVAIDPDRLFGRHLAILGNTGSGKSCSVAGLIRWSIEAAQKVRKEVPHSRFIILDPNGEYTNSFSDMENVRIYGVEKNETLDIKQLRVPLWLWNTAEWVSFAQASGKAQKPTLVQTLRCVRDGQIEATPTERADMRRFLRTLVEISTLEYKSGSPWGGFPKSKNFFMKIKKWKSGIQFADILTDEEDAALSDLNEYLDELITARDDKYAHHDFEKGEIESLISLLRKAHHVFGGSDADVLPIDADIPRPFTGKDFLRSLEANAELMDTSKYVETMLMRVKTILSDAKLKPVISSKADVTLENWLDQYICQSNEFGNFITIIDLSLLPTEIVHILTAVMARITLEALQRYRRENDGKTLPTVLVMEEAHTFIKHYRDDAENADASAMCTRVFEKIAREGRKFGLGLVLSSQRPSELSPTVLSQCNSFLLHRLSNDRDQELVSRLVPDNLRALLRELPSLPAQNAILLGWASELPVMVRMNHLHDEFRPRSDDPDYWETWTKNDRSAHWKSIAEEWQGYSTLPIYDSPT